MPASPAARTGAGDQPSRMAMPIERCRWRSSVPQRVGAAESAEGDGREQVPPPGGFVDEFVDNLVKDADADGLAGDEPVDQAADHLAFGGVKLFRVAPSVQPPS